MSVKFLARFQLSAFSLQVWLRSIKMREWESERSKYYDDNPSWKLSTQFQASPTQPELKKLFRIDNWLHCVLDWSSKDENSIALDEISHQKSRTQTQFDVVVVSNSKMTRNVLRPTTISHLILFPLIEWMGRANYWWKPNGEKIVNCDPSQLSSYRSSSICFLFSLFLLLYLCVVSSIFVSHISDGKFKLQMRIIGRRFKFGESTVISLLMMNDKKLWTSFRSLAASQQLNVRWSALFHFFLLQKNLIFHFRSFYERKRLNSSQNSNHRDSLQRVIDWPTLTLAFIHENCVRLWMGTRMRRRWRWELDGNYGDLHDGKQMMMMKMNAKTLIGVASSTSAVNCNWCKLCIALRPVGALTWTWSVECRWTKPTHSRRFAKSEM